MESRHGLWRFDPANHQNDIEEGISWTLQGQKFVNLPDRWTKFILLAGPFILLASIVAVVSPGYRFLGLLFLWTIVSNNVIPMPYEPVMVAMGAFYHPLLASTVAACGNIVAGFIDYEAIRYAFRLESLKRVKESAVYRGAVYYFLKAPFLSLVVAAFAPFIPFYLFRVLSPTSGYPLKRYMLAVFIGRLPRYYLFAYLGAALLPIPLLMACGVILFVSVVLYLLVRGHLGIVGLDPGSVSEASPGPEPRSAPGAARGEAGDTDAANQERPCQARRLEPPLHP